MELAKILKDLMHRDRVNITDLGRELKLPPSTLHGWLNGIEPKNIGQLKLVADYFHVSLDYICFGVETKSSSSHLMKEFAEEISAGEFELVIRKIKK